MGSENYYQTYTLGFYMPIRNIIDYTLCGTDIKKNEYKTVTTNLFLCNKVVMQLGYDSRKI
jgi:hypothetical protein